MIHSQNTHMLQEGAAKPQLATPCSHDSGHPSPMRSHLSGRDRDDWWRLQHAGDTRCSGRPRLAGYHYHGGPGGAAMGPRGGCHGAQGGLPWGPRGGCHGDLSSEKPLERNLKPSLVSPQRRLPWNGHERGAGALPNLGCGRRTHQNEHQRATGNLPKH